MSSPETPEDLVTVGRVGRPHGLAGAFVVENASDEPERFALGATLVGPDGPVEIVESKIAGGRRVVRVEPGVERGAELKVPRAQLEPAGEDEYYVFELVGMDVVEDGGRPLGRVARVSSPPANDVLELESGVALPFVGACVLEVDRERRRILVAAGFADPETIR
jgi:16S rRNA processing protein RimM